MEKIKLRINYLFLQHKRIFKIIPSQNWGNIEILLFLNKRVESLREVVAEFDKRLLDHDEWGACLKRVVDELKSAQLIDEEISPQSANIMPRYSEIPVTIKFRGEFKNICLFLNNVEKIPHLTRVKELKLQGSRKGKSQIGATMVLNVYCNRS